MSRRDDEMNDDLARLRAKKQTERDEAMIRALREANAKSAKARPHQVQRIEVQSKGKKAKTKNKNKKLKSVPAPAPKKSGCALILFATLGGSGALTLALTLKGWA